jgi:hypothetical protein
MRHLASMLNFASMALQKLNSIGNTSHFMRGLRPILAHILALAIYNSAIPVSRYTYGRVYKSCSLHRVTCSVTLMNFIVH